MAVEGGSYAIQPSEGELLPLSSDEIRAELAGRYDSHPAGGAGP
jgi:hypothetical protein